MIFSPKFPQHISNTTLETELSFIVWILRCWQNGKKRQKKVVIQLHVKGPRVKNFLQYFMKFYVILHAEADQSV